MKAALRRCAAGALLVLAGCTAHGPQLRDPEAPFGATTRFSPAAFAGDWYEVAVVQAEAQPPAQVKYRFAHDAAANRLVRVVLSGAARGPGTDYGIAGPGRLQPAGGGAEIWVFWVDEGFRTAVMGQRSGAETVILDRSPAPARDRLAAAKEILAWYGYDLANLKETRP